MRTLTTVREINAACLAASFGGGGYVWADVPASTRVRIAAARTRKGVLEVRQIWNGQWAAPKTVYVD